MHPDTVLRARGTSSDVEVTSAELFFDLVYVFAFIQLSGELYSNLTPLGWLETAVVFLPVWWAWNYTTWATNLIDPRRWRVVLLLAVLTGASLVMASAIPEAFGHRGVTFAIAYVTLQVVRGAFMVWALGRRSTMGRSYAQLLVWSAIAGLAWVGGAFVHDPHGRLAVWALAALIDLGAPLHGFRLPVLGATPIERWTLAGEHLAERCRLVLMIAFGESMLRLGETFTEHRGAAGVATAFGAGFVLAFALWTVYFLRHAERGESAMLDMPQHAARIGRSGYAYAHAVMVAGVIVIAVGIHLAVSHPTGHPSVAAAVCCLGGPALYLLGMVLFTYSIGHRRLAVPLGGIASLLIAGVPAALVEPLTVLIAAAAVAVVLAVVSHREEAHADLRR